MRYVDEENRKREGREDERFGERELEERMRDVEKDKRKRRGGEDEICEGE